MIQAPLESIALFKTWPALAAAFAYLPLPTLPTPVRNADTFARNHGMAAFYIKEDNKTGLLYGGNKTRKLAFLLAKAHRMQARRVITFGAAGSNHALATALYARELGLRASLILGPQFNSPQVRGNLLAALESGAELHPCEWRETAAVAAEVFHHTWKKDEVPPCVIPAGGSSPLGILGFVNAALELKEQVDAGQLAEPDYIYVASGTMGTCVGLALGLALARMKTRIMAVRVTTAPFTCVERAQRLFHTTAAMLHGAAPSCPYVSWQQAAFTLRDTFFGQAYALPTTEGVAAIRKAREELNVQLESTYTGKAFAALLNDANRGTLEDKHALFWNTYSGEKTVDTHDTPSWRRLPAPLHHYFESVP